ncbi:D-aminoacyl-tRNA deacylase-like isoform X2 [Nilaparvata lugens]|uniref:D-aminoacyl-tRNA deacylase-like isoform X2 n=1 Tax=Nilaparvata lugens TaxID=108931 RepID=UPI00193E3A54|nr:D-aminoacyl-tRNA deacylase-like isoform X2 [Nilaparvata lugens]
MKAVIQRVTSANVSVNGEVISAIQKGLCVLLSISRDDTIQQVEYMVNKILNVRLFDEETEGGKRWSKGVKDRGLEVLCISQITLYHTLKGNKPDFHLAMAPEASKTLFSQFMDRLRTSYEPEKVKEGQFGAYMQVSIQNDGPVTIILESPEKKDSTSEKRGV